MKSTSLVALAIGLSALLSHGQTVPAAINYQGRVTNSNGEGLGTGTPINRKMIFRLYDTATAGNPIWSEQQTVTLANGEFSVLLGTGIDASFGATARPSLLNVFGGSDRFLEIVVDEGDGILNISDAPIAPRQRLTSAAYAIRAATADSVAPGTDLNLRDSNNGLGWYGTGRLFNGQNIDGPVLYGSSGGALGSNQNNTQNIALRWNSAGNVGIGTAAASGSTKLVLSGALGLFDGATRSKSAGFNTENEGALIQMGVNEDSVNRFGGIFDSSTQGGLIRLDSRNGNDLFTIFGRPAGSNTAVAPLMTVSSTGSVKINGGLAAPINSLSGGVGSRLVLWPGSTTEAPYGFGMNDFVMWSSVPTNGNFKWYGGTTERMSLNGNTGSLLLVSGNLNFSDTTHGIGRQTSFGGVTMNGPLVYGSTKGALGTTSGGDKVALTWDNSKNVNVEGALNAIGNITSPNVYGSSVHAEGAGGYKFTGVGDTDGGLFSPADGTITIKTNNVERLRVNSSGNVGIGTTTPTLAKLQIAGGVLRDSITNVYWGVASGNTWGQSSTVTPVNYSIYADAFIMGQGFVSHSDERIKRVAGRSDGAHDLATIAGIEVTDYTHIDSLGSGTNKYKKVIAQQVEKVFPQAVSKATGVVPDIYQKAVVKDGWVTLATDLKVGERVRLIGEKEEAIHEVLEVRDGAFRTAFQSTSDRVFVFGREVKDFRSVDYEAISMLNVSATQQLKKEKDAEVKALRDENSELRSRIAALEATDKIREAKLSRIEKALFSTEPQTVSLGADAVAE